jgi:long-chain acyl-CoA synthetase
MQFSSLPDVLVYQAERLGPRPAIRFKKNGLYHHITWQQYAREAKACAAALIQAGAAFGDRVGILAENRPEWLIADMGLMTAGAINVPLHAPLTGKQVQFQLGETEARFLFVSTPEQLEKIRQVVGELPSLQAVILMDAGPGPEASIGQARLIPWDTFLQGGRAALARLSPEIEQRLKRLGHEDLATIMYTSGTTGNPKGVMLTHGNLLSNASSSLEVQPLNPEHVLLNWLPLSHIFARTVDHYQTLIAGTDLVLAESAETVMENVQEVQPTHLACVPRLYEKVLAACTAPDPEVTKKRLRGAFGTRIYWLSSGGAPLPKAIAKIYLEAKLPLFQGYGLTETSPVVSFNRPWANKVGTVGQALPGVEIKIALDGEVICRGPNIMRGYYHNPEATAEVLHDGWFSTGDLGSLDEEGYLSITGRKKELMVLSNGKKLVPSHLEGLLIADECIDQAAIYGEGRNFVSALIVPHWENLKKAMQARGVAVSDWTPAQAARNPEILRLLRERIDQQLANVSNWEQVKKFVVLGGPFTVAAEELTVSLKLRREVVVAHHAHVLEALYAEAS